MRRPHAVNGPSSTTSPLIALTRASHWAAAAATVPGGHGARVSSDPDSDPDVRKRSESALRDRSGSAAECSRRARQLGEPDSSRHSCAPRTSLPGWLNLGWLAGWLGWLETRGPLPRPFVRPPARAPLRPARGPQLSPRSITNRAQARIAPVRGCRQAARAAAGTQCPTAWFGDCASQRMATANRRVAWAARLPQGRGRGSRLALRASTARRGRQRRRCRRRWTRRTCPKDLLCRHTIRPT